MTPGSTRLLVIVAAGLLGCSSSSSKPGGAGGGGEGGAGGEAGTSGSDGSAGTGGASGTGGQSGTSGTAGGGASGSGGMGGTSGASGTGDTDAAVDATSGTDTASAGADVAAGGPAKIVLVAGGGNGGDGGPAATAKLAEPFGVTVDPMTGEIYISEYASGHVRRIDAQGMISTVVGAGAMGPGGMVTLKNPHDLLFQPGTRNLFIADTFASRVLKMDAATGMVTPFAGAGTQVAAGVKTTYHLSFDHAGDHLYVTDNGGGKIDEIDLKTNAVTTITVASPRCVTVDSKGNVYVVSVGQAVMRVFDPMGGMMTAVGGLNAPKHLAIEPDDNVLIADTESHVIRRWKPGSATAPVIAGTEMMATGTLGGDPLKASFNRPHGLFVDMKGVIYIADSENNRVLRIEQ